MALKNVSKMPEVFTNQYRIYEGSDVFARVSQCVGVGVISSKKGLAHIHSNTNLSILEDLFEQTFDSGEIYLCGGVDAFVPQMGFIPGSRNAERVLDYLHKNGLESYLIQSDIYTDYVRIMSVSKRGCKIHRF